MTFEFEEDRQRYLREFGVTPWYARQALSGAHESRTLSFRSTTRGCIGDAADTGTLTSDPLVLTSEMASSEPINAAPGADFSSAKINSAQQLIAASEEGGRHSDEGMRRQVDPAQILSFNLENLPNTGRLSAENYRESDEVWCRYSWGGSSQQTEGSKVILAKLSVANPSIERLLLKNIVKSLLADSELPNVDDFFWPPFFCKNVPLQNESLKNKLLARWINESMGSVLTVFSRHVIQGLESANYCPSLADLILKPQSKHGAWDKLNQLRLP